MAFYTEVVIRFLGQVAGSGGRLYKPLGQRDAGRDFIFALMLYGNVLIFTYVVEVDGIFALRADACRQQQESRYEQRPMYGTYEKESFHVEFCCITLVVAPKNIIFVICKKQIIRYETTRTIGKDNDL